MLGLDRPDRNKVFQSIRILTTSLDGWLSFLALQKAKKLAIFACVHLLKPLIQYGGFCCGPVTLPIVALNLVLSQVHNHQTNPIPKMGHTAVNKDGGLSAIRRRLASFFLFPVQQPLRNPMTPNSHFSIAGDPDRPDHGEGEQCH